MPAANIDEEWKVYMDIWEREFRLPRLLRELKEAEEDAAWLCPGGKPQTPETILLWKEAKVQQLVLLKEAEFERLFLSEPTGSQLDCPSRVNLNHVQQLLIYYRIAQDVANHNADRVRSGKWSYLGHAQPNDKNMSIVEVVIAIQKATDGLEDQENFDESFRAWVTQVPSDAHNCQKSIEHIHKRTNNNLKYFKDRLATLVCEAEKWVANEPATHL